MFACIACLVLLGALALPALATTPSRSHVAQCLNNLRQMGRAVQIWGDDHREQTLWQTYHFDGGTRPSTGTKSGNAWFEFAYLSNELVTPRILSCPADTAKVASEFSGDAARGGYASASFRGLATSYFINLHTEFEYPRGPLFGDRNVRAVPGGTCTYGATGAFQVSSSDTNVGWTNALHGFQGNVVRVDGTAEVTTSDEVRNAFGLSDERPQQHLLRGGL